MVVKWPTQKVVSLISKQTLFDKDFKKKIPNWTLLFSSLWYRRFTQTHRSVLWTISLLKKEIQFLVIRLLNYKNEVLFFTCDNSNGTICQRIRVKLHSSYIFSNVHQKDHLFKMTANFYYFWPLPPSVGMFYYYLLANLANFLTPPP